jgi:chromosome segregation ATPase
MARSGQRSQKQSGWGMIFIGTTVGVIAWNNQLIEDWLVPVPPPSGTIARLAESTTMTPKAQRLFYRQVPTIEQKASFMSRCKVPEQGIMLGCYSYHDGQGKIVIQSVLDPRLQGVMEITAAHEMLHAAYQRLDQSTQKWLAPRLKRATRLVKDQRLAKILQQYATGNNDALYLNELHSHLGTELADLQDPELEQYYQKYFDDRTQVTALAQQSGAALKDLDTQADRLKPQIDTQEANLKQLKQELDTIENELKRSASNLEQLGTHLDQTKQAAEQAFHQGEQPLALVHQFEQEKAAFNAQVDDHNERVRQQKERVASFNQKVDAYKQNVQAYNRIATEERSLMDGLRGETGSSATGTIHPIGPQSTNRPSPNSSSAPSTRNQSANRQPANRKSSSISQSITSRLQQSTQFIQQAIAQIKNRH